MDIIRAVKRLVHFLTVDIWRIRTEDLSRFRGLLLEPLKVIVLSVRSFREDKCGVRASALTYYTLLSTVQVVAVAFGIAKGFGYDKVLQKTLEDNYPGHETIVSKIIEYSTNLLDNTRGGLIAGIGIVLLLWVLIKVIGHIEGAFNDIWNVKKHRTLIRKFSDYLSIVIVCTIGLIIYNSLTVFISSQIEYVIEKLSLTGFRGPLMEISFRTISILVIWAVFMFIYIVVPNTRVGIKAAFVGGAVAGTIYQVVQWVYIVFQIGVAKYNAIYGSFAALPLFLIWIHMSWVILLFGAEMAFAMENVKRYESEIESRNISWRNKKRLALLTAHRVVKNFARGGRPLTAPGIAEDLGMPVRLVRQILSELVDAGVFSKTESEDPQETAFQPACDIDFFTVKCIIDTLENLGSDNLQVERTDDFERLSGILESFEDAFERSDENVLLSEI